MPPPENHPAPPPTRPGRTYLSSREFYDANEERARSKERDYGVWWRTHWDWPTFRVTYVYATGEVIAVCQPSGAVEVLGTLEPDDPHAADRALEGWPEQCGELGSLAWARARVRKAKGTA